MENPSRSPASARPIARHLSKQVCILVRSIDSHLITFSPCPQKLKQNVAAGHVLENPSVRISFPQDNSTQSQLDRIGAAVVTLQNLDGIGKGCPVVSTTFQAQAAAIRAHKPLPPPVVPGPSLSSPLSSSPSGVPTPEQITALAPQLGFTSGKNPTGKPLLFECFARAL